jgi:putative DNA methylase
MAHPSNPKRAGTFSRMIYPKRLIEVDLPIKRISAHARREKSIRHGHISTLHIWWARRPLAACRAVICAALWLDPADENCPPAFRNAAAKIILDFAGKIIADTKLANEHCSPENFKAWSTLVQKPPADKSFAWLRTALLDFIADFSSWYNSTVREYVETSRAFTQAAHEALGGAPGTRPLIVDPFAGGGSIPLEALRVGADAFASDLNPIPVLLNKVVLEYIPKYGQRLADEVRKWGEWIKLEAEKELVEFYPKDADGATPIAYLWARTIQCEGPGCGAEVPLVRNLWLAKKDSRSVALQIVPNPKAKRVDFKIIVKTKHGWVNQDEAQDPKAKTLDPKFDGAVKRGSATCPCCGYTTQVARVRAQLKERRGGANDSRMMCVAGISPDAGGRRYRLPNESDFHAIQKAKAELQRRKASHKGKVSLIPDEPLDSRGIRHTWAMIYGFENQGDFYTTRQMLALTTLTRLVNEVGAKLKKEHDAGFAAAVQTGLAFAVSKESDLTNSLCSWKPDAECPVHMMARQAIPMLWDFTEAVATSESSGSWSSMVERTAYAISSAVMPQEDTGQVIQCSATEHALPADSAHAFITDPPYYDAVPYAYLSDFFYVWLRRSLASVHEDLFARAVVPKDEEIVVDRPHELSNSTHDIAFYERELTKAFSEGRRVVQPNGIGVIVFASKTTASWEAILKAVVDAGWIITGSWPIDTEMEARVAAQGQARLASSVHLVCRPRENLDGSVRTDEIGDWRDVLQELPRRIHEWMPRLAEEGVVGADAIFACLGPALEIFSRYSRVEKASGETVTLKEYLECVWAAVAKEALTIIFPDADTIGFEEDARLTAMWLWTLTGGKADTANGENADDEDADDESEGGAKKTKTTGFVLEYDAARKIAQGLGAHLEDLSSLVEVSGDQARLLPVGERARHLFGKEEGKVTPCQKKESAATRLVQSARTSRRRRNDFRRNKSRTSRRNRPRPHPPEHDSFRRRSQRSVETIPRRRRRRPRPTLLASCPSTLRALSFAH